MKLIPLLRILFIVALLFISSPSSSSSFVHAWNYTTTLTKDKRIAVVLGVFGHSEFGKTQVSIKNLLLQAANPNAVGASTFTAKTWIELRKVKSVSVAKKLKKQIEKEDDGTCADVEEVDLEEMSTPMKHFLKYLKAPRHEDEDDLKATITFTVKEAGLYALVFARCISPTNIKVVASAPLIKVSQYNPSYTKTSDGAGIDMTPTFLSIGENPLPMIYGGFAVLFSVGTFLWYRELTTTSTTTSSSSGMNRGGGGVMRVHYAMLIVGMLKTLTLFLESGVYAHRNSTGGTGATVDVIFVIVSAIKTAILFVIVILLGTGWSISKAFVSECEQKLIWSVLVVQLIVNVALATIEEGTPIGSDKVYTARLLLRVMDLLCALVILIPIIRHAKSQHEAAMHRQNSEAVGRSIDDNNDNNDDNGGDRFGGNDGGDEELTALRGREELSEVATTISHDQNQATRGGVGVGVTSLLTETPETIITVVSNNTGRKRSAATNNSKNTTLVSDADMNDDDENDDNNKETIRLKTFRSFYIATFVFLYFTRLLVPYLENHLSYLFLWVPHLLYELAAFIFYYTSCYLFQPAIVVASHSKLAFSPAPGRGQKGKGDRIMVANNEERE